MRTAPYQHDRRPLGPWRIGLLGAMLGIGLSLVFWLSSAAKILPSGAPLWLLTFDPQTGIPKLIEGLVFAGIGGGTLFFLAGCLYGLIHRGRPVGGRAGDHPAES